MANPIAGLLTLSLSAALALSACETCDALVGPAPPEAAPAAYDLGLMPAGLDLRWPARPQVEEEVEIGSDADLNAAWTASNARVRVRGQVDQLVIDADDVEVRVDDGMFVGSLVVMPGHRRIHVRGGSYGQIVLEGPTRLLEPPPAWRAVDMTEDVLFEDVEVSAISSGLSGVLLRGRRIALVNSQVDAQFHAVFVGDTAPVQSEDVVIAGCSLSGTGEDPTVVLRDVRRAALVDTWMDNPLVSGLQVHGNSEWVVASRNTLVGGGFAAGDEEGDDLAEVWFWVNTAYQSAPELLSLAPDRIGELVLADNVIYSDSATCVWCGPTPESWLVERNRVRSYRAPPERP